MHLLLVMFFTVGLWRSGKLAKRRWRVGRGPVVLYRALGLLAVSGVLASCGSSAGTASSPAPASMGPMVAEQGPFLGECGGVSDAEFLEITGIAPDASISRNLVGCQWDSPTGHGSFSWYRGSPIEREYTIVDTVGRTVRSITINGQEGYEGSDSGSLCEVGIAFGDDFFVWSVVLPPTVARPACQAAQQLATMTVERAQ